MPTSRTGTRPISPAAASARTEILAQLKEDHKRVKKAYREFEKLDLEEDLEAGEALVLQVLDELTVHATLEEELLYPAARDSMADASLDWEALAAEMTLRRDELTPSEDEAEVAVAGEDQTAASANPGTGGRPPSATGRSSRGKSRAGAPSRS